MTKRVEKQAQEIEGVHRADIYVLCEGQASAPIDFTPAHSHFLESESETDTRDPMDELGADAVTSPHEDDQDASGPDSTRDIKSKEEPEGNHTVERGANNPSRPSGAIIGRTPPGAGEFSLSPTSIVTFDQAR